MLIHQSLKGWWVGLGAVATYKAVRVVAQMRECMDRFAPFCFHCSLHDQVQVYSLDQIGASSSAIAQAASQAIAATQLVSGRRSSSLKASYEAINLGVATSEFSIGRELATAANSALAATSTDLTSSGQPQQVCFYLVLGVSL